MDQAATQVQLATEAALLREEGGEKLTQSPDGNHGQSDTNPTSS